MRFVEVEDLAAYLHRTLDEDDLLANLACDAASGVVAEYIDQGTVYGATEVVLEGDGVSDALMLPVFPVHSIETVTIDAGLATEEILDAADYVLGDAGIIYRLDEGSPAAWDFGHRNITVEFTSGYEPGGDYEAASNLPASISLVALQVAARIYEVGMAENESTAGYSVTHVKGTGALTPYEKDILAHYRLEV